MSLYLDTRGRACLAVGICDRCSRKFPIGDLHPDANSPGLMVCRADRDELDPFRLPPRMPENITLRFARPDVDISIPADAPASPPPVIDGAPMLDTHGAPFVLDQGQVG